MGKCRLCRFRINVVSFSIENIFQPTCLAAVIVQANTKAIPMPKALQTNGHRVRRQLSIRHLLITHLPRRHLSVRAEWRTQSWKSQNQIMETTFSRQLSPKNGGKHFDSQAPIAKGDLMDSDFKYWHWFCDVVNNLLARFYSFNFWIFQSALSSIASIILIFLRTFTHRWHLPIGDIYP